MGHPDKVADHLADAVLDRVLASDPKARVACEVLVSGRRVILAGEVSASPLPTRGELRRLVRETIAAVGYDSWESGFDPRRARLQFYLRRQSPDIARAVDGAGEIGAGDQGMMIGYATRQTPELMPLPLVLSHRLAARQAVARVQGLIPGLRPDAKAQVTVAYEGHRPLQVEALVLSTQHTPAWNERQGDLAEEVTAHILKPALGDWWHEGLVTHINPGGPFCLGGPAADTGLTGRKIIVDTYGGWAPHGGGSFSGKDATKVDRSASYMARHVAKNVVAAGLAAECEVHLSYAIGVAAPTSVSVDCSGTEAVPEERIEALVREVFPLTPGGIIADLGLRRPIFAPASYHGHFGRTPGEAGEGTFSWESTHRAAELAAACGLAAPAS
ncbi:MAG: methionine adenosyltransferase [Acidimicrobiia bacterium]|nr:methionine adenosyltransferase [Acidimicrobiia bacterium]